MAKKPALRDQVTKLEQELEAKQQENAKLREELERYVSSAQQAEITLCAHLPEEVTGALQWLGVVPDSAAVAALCVRLYQRQERLVSGINNLRQNVCQATPVVAENKGLDDELAGASVILARLHFWVSDINRTLISQRQGTQRLVYALGALRTMCSKVHDRYPDHAGSRHFDEMDVDNLLQYLSGVFISLDGEVVSLQGQRDLLRNKVSQLVEEKDEVAKLHKQELAIAHAERDQALVLIERVMGPDRR